jgi:hypothetical protein
LRSSIVFYSTNPIQPTSENIDGRFDMMDTAKAYHARALRFGKSTGFHLKSLVYLAVDGLPSLSWVGETEVLIYPIELVLCPCFYLLNNSNKKQHKPQL